MSVRYCIYVFEAEALCSAWDGVRGGRRRYSVKIPWSKRTVYWLIFFAVTQRWRILEETRCEVILMLFYLLQSSQLELHLHLHHCHFQHKLFSLLPRLATSLIQRSDILPTWILRILWRIMYLLTTRPVHRLARYCKTKWTLQKKSCVECVSFRAFRPISHYFWSQSKLRDGALFLFNMIE